VSALQTQTKDIIYSKIEVLWRIHSCQIFGV